jgi:hypothetical protein
MRLWVKQLPSETFYVDDIVIGAWLWKNNVRPRIIKICNNLKLYHHDAENTQELSSDNLKYRNIKVFYELYSLGYYKKQNYYKIIIIFIIFIFLIIFVILLRKKYYNSKFSSCIT